MVYSVVNTSGEYGQGGQWGNNHDDIDVPTAMGSECEEMEVCPLVGLRSVAVSGRLDESKEEVKLVS